MSRSRARPTAERRWTAATPHRSRAGAWAGRTAPWRGAGYQGDFVELDDGALVLVAEEGDDYSALVGEESLDYRGTRILVLRSSHAGDVDSEAIATTPPFELTHAALWWWQLSEVGDHGVEVRAQLLDTDGQVLAEAGVPAVTGGYVPALEDYHDPIVGCPEIGYGEPSVGELIPQGIDVSAWLGQTVQLRLLQHTRIDNNGFFTLIDDICHGPDATASAAGVAVSAWDR